MESELSTHFRSLFARVTSTEAAALASARAAGVALPPSQDEAGRPLPPRLPEGCAISASVAEVEAVLRDFGGSWRGSLKALHDGVLRNFPDARAGQGVLRATMGAFVALYERFHAVLTRAFPPTAPFLRDVVPSPTICFELRRFSTSYGNA